MNRPPPRWCIGCSGHADRSLNGVDLCPSCMDLVRASGGGEGGLAALMRYGPELLRDLINTTAHAAALNLYLNAYDKDRA